MPSHCCVPECTQRGYQSNDGGKVSFFNFPKALIKQKQWIHAIRRDEGKEFQINQSELKIRYSGMGIAFF